MDIQEAPSNPTEQIPLETAGPDGTVGRPPFVPTKAHLDQVMLLGAMGVPVVSIWSILGISQHTFEKHFGEAFKNGRYIIKAKNYMRLDRASAKGNVAAIKEMNRIIEKADISDAAARFIEDKPAEPVKEEKPGKKEAAIVAAKNPDASTPIGALMARRAKLRVVGGN